MPSDTEWPITLSASTGIKRPIMQNPKCKFWKGVIWTSIVHFQILSSSISLSLTHTHIHTKVSNIYILFVHSYDALSWCRSGNDASTVRNAIGGERGQQLRGKKKARTIQSLWMRYFRCRMDIRVEIWQSAPALMGSGIDNDQWLGQWDVSMQAGKLIKWH